MFRWEPKGIPQEEGPTGGQGLKQSKETMDGFPAYSSQYLCQRLTKLELQPTGLRRCSLQKASRQQRRGTPPRE